MNNGALVWPSIPRYYSNYFNWTDPCVVRDRSSLEWWLQPSTETFSSGWQHQHRRRRHHLDMFSRLLMLIIAFVIIYYAF